MMKQGNSLHTKKTALTYQKFMLSNVLEEDQFSVCFFLKILTLVGTRIVMCGLQ